MSLADHCQCQASSFTRYNPFLLVLTKLPICFIMFASVTHRQFGILTGLGFSALLLDKIGALMFGTFHPMLFLAIWFRDCICMIFIVFVYILSRAREVGSPVNSPPWGTRPDRPTLKPVRGLFLLQGSPQINMYNFLTHMNNEYVH